MQLEHRRLALLKLHLHSRLNTWLQYIAQRQLLDETRNISVWGFGASNIRDLMVLKSDLCLTASFTFVLSKSLSCLHSLLYFWNFMWTWISFLCLNKWHVIRGCLRIFTSNRFLLFGSVWAEQEPLLQATEGFFGLWCFLFRRNFTILFCAVLLKLYLTYYSICHDKALSTLVWVMTCSLMVPSHYQSSAMLTYHQLIWSKGTIPMHVLGKGSYYWS